MKAMLLMTIALVSAIHVQLAAGETRCVSEIRKLPVNRETYLKQQKFVNAGHEPWRLDARLVAAEQILILEKVPQSDWDPASVHLALVSERRQRATFRFGSGPESSPRYLVIVRRFKWQLPAAKNFDWAIWIPTEVEITRCRSSFSRH